MKHKIKQVLSEIFNKRIEIPYTVDPAELPESTQHLLSAYVEAELDGENAANLYPEVKAAMAKFPAFAEEHKVLYELLDADRRGELEEPPTTPVFDFSYLNLPPVADSTETKSEWGFDVAGRLIIQFTEELITSLQERSSQLTPLHNLKRGEEEWKTWIEYKLPRPTSDLDVVVTVKHVGNESAFCNVVVKVDIPSRKGWPALAGSEVQMNCPQMDTLSQKTDAFGEVVFESIAKTTVSHLKFEVNPVYS